MISYVLLCLFTVAAALNLIGTKKGREKLFGATKPALLSLLLLYAIFGGSEGVNIYLCGALLFCLIGDVLLMPKGTGWFVAGGISFFVGHVWFIFLFAGRIDFASVPVAVLIPAWLVYGAAAIAVSVRIEENVPVLMRVPMFLYLFFNASTNMFALCALIESASVWSALAFAGTVFFFVSDCALLLYRFEPERARFYKTNFFVMLTYICAVFLITLGIARI